MTRTVPGPARSMPSTAAALRMQLCQSSEVARLCANANSPMNKTMRNTFIALTALLLAPLAVHI
jgi:hypothetical protein